MPWQGSGGGCWPQSTDMAERVVDCLPGQASCGLGPCSQPGLSVGVLLFQGTGPTGAMASGLLALELLDPVDHNSGVQDGRKSQGEVGEGLASDREGRRGILFKGRGEEWHLGARLLGSRNARALKCANELGEDGVTRAKAGTEKYRVKQKKGNNENWRVLSLWETDTPYSVETIALALGIREL